MFASALWETASQSLTSCCRNETEAELAASASLPFPAGSAGAIDQVVGAVAIIRGTGAIEAAAPGITLADGDFLQAAGSSVVVALADGRRIAVQERGQLIVHAPEAGDAVAVEAAGGRFVVLAGRALDGRPDLLIITPAARIHPGSAAIAFRHAAADGLQVMLAEDATADGVVVENGFGRAVIRKGDEVVSVGGSDQPPVLDHDPSLAVADAGLPPEATSGLTLEEGVDISPGGDMAAFPGDPVVSHAEADLFDLEPQTLALPDPVYGAVLTRDSSWATAPRTMTQLLLQGGSSQQPQAVESAPTGRQLRGWEPLGLTWDILGGDAEVTPAALDVGPRRLGRVITPTEAGSMARLVSSTHGVGAIDDFFGLAPDTVRGSLTGVVATSTSAIRSSQVRLTAGSTLSFDWFFDAANQSPRRDTALFVVDDKVFKLADSADVGAHGASGWRTFVWHVDKTGVYSLGFATINDHTVDDASRLYVDNVRRDRSFGNDYGLADSGDGWEVLVRKPTLQDDTLSVGEDGLGTTNALANDADWDPFDPMILTGVNREGTVGLPGYVPEGVVSFDARGRFDYLAVGQTATTSFRYEADAGNGATATAVVQVTIVGANDAPVARPDAPVVAADASRATFDVLANDDDVDSDDDRTSLRVVAAEAASGAPVDLTGRPGEGIVYHPDGRFVALAEGETATDVITYTVEDQHGARTDGQARLTVVGRNDAPVAAADRHEGSEDAAVVLAVLANDRDPDGSDRLHVVAVDGRPLAEGGSVALTSGAVVSLTIDGALTYDPAASFTGLADGANATDTFRYQISDDHGGFAEALATVRIEGRNDAPVAIADAVALNAGATLDIAVLANDDDPDGDDGPLSLRIVAAQAISSADVRFTGQPGEGVVYDSGERFRALGAEETAADIVTYTIADRHGARSTATVAVTVGGVNDIPTATADIAVTTEDTAVAIAAAANDSDPDAHDRLTIVAIDDEAIAPGGQVVLASGAIVALDAAGALSWVPAGRFDGLAEGETATDHFRYRIADGHGGFAEADVTMRIDGRNDAPIARPDSAAAGEDAIIARDATVIDVLANDDDVDSDDNGSSLRVVGASAASGAVVEIAEDGRHLRYAAQGAWERLGAGETATDTITYTIADRHGVRSVGTVAVTVTGANDGPLAVADTLMIDASSVLRLPGPSILANDRDPDSHDTRTIIAVDGARQRRPDDCAGVGRAAERRRRRPAGLRPQWPLHRPRRVRAGDRQLHLHHRRWLRRNLSRHRHHPGPGCERRPGGFRRYGDHRCGRRRSHPGSEQRCRSRRRQQPAGPGNRQYRQPWQRAHQCRRHADLEPRQRVRKPGGRTAGDRYLPLRPRRLRRRAQHRRRHRHRRRPGRRGDLVAGGDRAVLRGAVAAGGNELHRLGGGDRCSPEPGVVPLSPDPSIGHGGADCRGNLALRSSGISRSASSPAGGRSSTCRTIRSTIPRPSMARRCGRR
ncbi:MAG: Ig-like domain-containing protein [Rhodospirillales bacterium]